MRKTKAKEPQQEPVATGQQTAKRRTRKRKPPVDTTSASASVVAPDAGGPQLAAAATKTARLEQIQREKEERRQREAERVEATRRDEQERQREAARIRARQLEMEERERRRREANAERRPSRDDNVTSIETARKPPQQADDDPIVVKLEELDKWRLQALRQKFVAVKAPLVEKVKARMADEFNRVLQREILAAPEVLAAQQAWLREINATTDRIEVRLPDGYAVLVIRDVEGEAECRYDPEQRGVRLQIPGKAG